MQGNNDIDQKDTLNLLFTDTKQALDEWERVNDGVTDDSLANSVNEPSKKVIRLDGDENNEIQKTKIKSKKTVILRTIRQRNKGVRNYCDKIYIEPKKLNITLKITTLLLVKSFLLNPAYAYVLSHNKYILLYLCCKIIVCKNFSGPPRLTQLFMKKLVLVSQNLYEILPYKTI